MHVVSLRYRDYVGQAAYGLFACTQWMLLYELKLADSLDTAAILKPDSRTPN